MSIYSWQLPGPPAIPAPGAGVGAAPVATASTPLGGALDQLLDPVTLDYLDATDGSWTETADSRTMFLIMAETRLGASYSAPQDGTRIAQYLESGDPVTPEFVAAEYTRIAQTLASAGVLRGFQIAIRDANGAPLVDAAGKFSPQMTWTDLASGTIVDKFTVGI